MQANLLGRFLARRKCFEVIFYFLKEENILEDICEDAFNKRCYYNSNQRTQGCWCNQSIQTNLFKRFLVRRKLFQCFIFPPREEEYYLQMLVVKKTTLEMLFVTDEVLQNDDFAEEKDKEIINTELQVNIFLDILGFIVIDVLYCSRSYKTLHFLVKLI